MGVPTNEWPTTAAVADTDDMLVNASGKSRRFLFSALKTKIGEWLKTLSISTLKTADKTVPGAINELNTNFENTNVKTYYDPIRLGLASSAPLKDIVTKAPDGSILMLDVSSVSDKSNYVTLNYGVFVVHKRSNWAIGIAYFGFGANTTQHLYWAGNITGDIVFR